MTRAGAVFRLLCLAAVALLAAPLQYVANKRRWALADRIPVGFHRLLCRLFDVRVREVGTAPARGQPVLVLANHASWLDIPVIASLHPVSFVAKSEIAGWPVVGWLARLQRCVFLDRERRRSGTAAANAVISERLTEADAILLFPEGTTGDGLRLLPFRSAIVGAVEMTLARTNIDGILLAPLALVYLRRGGLPITRRDRPEVAWYGDMELVPHLGTCFAGGPIEVVAVWGDPVLFRAGSDRKTATLAMETSIASAVGAVRSGKI